MQRACYATTQETGPGGTSNSTLGSLLSYPARPGFHDDARGRRRQDGRSGRVGLVATGVRFSDITTRRLLYWLAAMVALLVVGTTIGLIWADTSDAAGAFAGVTNLVSVVAIVVLLIVLVFRHTRRPKRTPPCESPE